VPTATLIIGRDEVGEEFTILHYDSRGVSRVYRMMFDDGAWRMWQDAPGFWQRFSGRLSADATRSEERGRSRRTVRHWEHDFDLLYTKVG
jgi:hypothetical protein